MMMDNARVAAVVALKICSVIFVEGKEMEGDTTS